MIKKIFKKCITILLTIALLIMPTAISVNGANIGTEEQISLYTELSDKDLLIPEEVAEYRSIFYRGYGCNRYDRLGLQHVYSRLFHYL